MTNITIGFVPRERFSSAAESLESILTTKTDTPFEMLIVDCATPPSIVEPILALAAMHPVMMRAVIPMAAKEHRSMIDRIVAIGRSQTVRTLTRAIHGPGGGPEINAETDLCRCRRRGRNCGRGHCQRADHGFRKNLHRLLLSRPTQSQARKTLLNPR